MLKRGRDVVEWTVFDFNLGISAFILGNKKPLRSFLASSTQLISIQLFIDHGKKILCWRCKDPSPIVFSIPFCLHSNSYFDM